MRNASEMVLGKRLMGAFLKWGIRLVEDIENEVVAPGNVVRYSIHDKSSYF